MQLIKAGKAKLTLIVALTGILIALSATVPTVSAQDSAPIQPVQSGEKRTNAGDDCADKLAVAEQRLLKSLDALSHAEVLVKLKDNEIAARKNIEDLYKQAIAVKDLIIKFQDELIKKLQKPNSGFMGRLKQILAIAEKVALIALGVGVGRGL